MVKEVLSLLSGEVLEEDVELTLAELCDVCKVPAERIIRLVDEGILEPAGRAPSGWRFRGISVRQVRCVQRLECDLGVNTAGAALALDLLEEIDAMRERLRRLEG